MPMRSTSSASCFPRKPAVSTTCTGTPSICMVCCTASRVVPAIGVTMANSAPASALSNELFPALGCPAITTRTPSRNKAPCCVFCITRAKLSCRRESCPLASACCKKSISSSGKSSVASTKVRRWIRALRSCSIS